VTVVGFERKPGVDALAAGLEVFRRRSERLAPVVAELMSRARAGGLSVPLAELAPSYLHTHANRLLRSAHRAQELARQSAPRGATPTADAVFAALAQQFLPAVGTPSAVPARPPAAAAGAPNPVDSRAGLALVGRPGAGPLAADPGDVPLANTDSPSPSVTDAWFTDLADDPLAPVGADPWLDRPW
jgi:hypothetical protein